MRTLFLSLILTLIALTAFGQQWEELPGPTREVRAIEAYNGDLYTCSNLLYVSKNNGETWEPLNNEEIDCVDFAMMGNSMFLINQNGVLLSSNDLGITWDTPQTTLTNFGSFGLNKINDSILIASQNGGSFDFFEISIDSGKTFELVIHERVIDFAVWRDTTYTLIRDRSSYNAPELLVHLNDFSSTVIDTLTLPHSESISRFWMIDSVMIVLGTHDRRFDPTIDSIGYLFSYDFGRTWEFEPYFTSPIDTTIFIRFAYVDSGVVYGFGSRNPTNVAGNKVNGLYRTDDYGKNWILVSNLTNHFLHYDIIRQDSMIYAINSAGVVRSDDNGFSWQEKNQGMNRLYDHDFTRFLVDDNAIYTVVSGGISHKSTDRGSTWLRHVSEISSLDLAPELWAIDNLLKYDSVIIESNINRGYYRSIDNGQTYMESQRSIDFRNDFVYHNGQVYLFQKNRDVLTSTDHGLNWQQLPSNLNFTGRDLPVLLGDTMIFDDYTFGVIYTYDGGITWDTVPGINGPFGYHDGIVYAYEQVDSNGQKIGMISRDFGKTWKQKGKGLYNLENSGAEAFDLLPIDNVMLLATNKGFYVTKNQGDCWIPFETVPMNMEKLVEVVSHQDKIYVATDRLYSIETSELMNIVNDNSFGCGYVSGIVYEELDSCNLDSAQYFFENTLVKFTPGAYFTSTDVNGNYSTALPYGNYITEVVSPKYHFPKCPADSTYSITLDSINSFADSINFGLQKLANYEDLFVSISNGPLRLGFQGTYVINYFNVGTEAMDGIVKLEIDTNLIFDHSIPFPSLDTGNIYYWEFDSLAVGESRSIIINVSVPVEISLIGQMTYTNAAVYPIITDAYNIDNFDTAYSIITASYDPNDKQVWPVGAGAENNIRSTDTLLTYTIRFQNTGNDTAFTVVLLDTISEVFDLTTLKMGAASHEYDFDIIVPRILRWTFNNILLPDSNVNELESHGFVKYTIELNDSLQQLTEITNRAGIYFDFNPVVLTNTALNTINDAYFVNSTGRQAVEEFSFYLMPNPTSGELNLWLPKSIAGYTIGVYNIIGERVYFQQDIASGTSELHLDTEAEGMYLVKVTDDRGRTATRKVILSK